MCKTLMNSLDLSLGHTLAHCRVQKGEEEKLLFFCIVCGAYASRRCHLLGKECQQHQLSGAPTTLRRIYDGLYPHYRKRQSSLTTTSRRGVANLAYAAALPPPAELAVQQPTRSALPQNPRMEALLLRVQAREAAAKAAVDLGT